MTCVYPKAPEQSACNDGDPCTNDACQDGVCKAVSNKDCHSLDGTCTVGVCDNGTCKARPLGGKPCNDGLTACDSAGMCGDNGKCIGLSDLCGPLATACAPCKTGQTCSSGRQCTCPSGVPLRAGICGSPCVADTSEVVMIGDSYITGAASPALQPALVSLMPNASGFRNYAVAGTALASGGITGFIPPQFDQAVAQNSNIDLVILSGGLSDITVCDTTAFPGCNTTCKTTGSSTATVCTDIVSKARTAFNELLAEMSDAGVDDVIYFLLPHLPAANSGFNEIIDYASKLLADDCANTLTKSGGKLACHFIDLRQTFVAAGGDMNPANFVADAIHPSSAGQTAIATDVIAEMKSSCLGQSPSSGCCIP